ncbi:MAG: BON domain-containing protein [Bryobacterales bacterium]|nr:BON domain-containing protein [Bryobacterales bacterium]
MRTVILLLALVWTLGAADPKPAARPPTAVQARTRPPARADADIETDIRQRFSRSKIAEDRFSVKVRSGVAVIEGKTNVIQRKGVATRLAKLGGARRVDNQIQIAPEARAAAAARLEQGRVRRQGHTAERRRVQPEARSAP